MNIYVSQDEKVPKDGSCEKQYFSEKTFLVYEKNGGKTFESNNIYISFLSIKGCSINVKAHFVDLKINRKVREKKQS